MSGYDCGEAQRHLVAALTAYHHGGTIGAAKFIGALTVEERADMGDTALGMLVRELELGCADSGIDMGDYLMHLGQSVA